MKKRNNNLYIITGGPGMGKTSIIEQLSIYGHICVPETGREIIQEQMLSGSNALPWLDKKKFAGLMFERSAQDYIKASKLHTTVFFDRGILDVIGYMELEGIEIDEGIMDAIDTYRYNSTVFITPPWKEIYVNDTERKQTFEEAVATYEMMKRVYSKYDYKLLELPKTTIEERVEFILRESS